MKKILQWARWGWSMGARYVLFRIFFELKRKTGFLRKSFPVNPSHTTWITLAAWREQAMPFFFAGREAIRIDLPSSVVEEKASRIQEGELQFFYGEWKKLDLNDWTRNPSTGYQYDVTQHWTQIPDFSPKFGDIKYVWEKSRFTFLQTVLRRDATTGKDSSGWVFEQIESWIDNNPINCGPNYRCSQEVSLRVFNWILALYFYRNAPGLTEARFEKILFHVYWQMKHVRENIHFSRIAVRNNHAITETLALYTAGLLFPFFAEANEWKKSGKRWFEEEIAYQLYPDGGFLQFSFNYHRVVIQLLTWALSIAHKHGESFSGVVYERAYASVNLLLHCQSENGTLSNYGSNDGALFFQWNDEAFRDFRPSLDVLHFLLTGSNFYSGEFEDRIWFGVHQAVCHKEPVRVQPGAVSFPHAGLYLYRTSDLLVSIGCTRYKDRPLQADMLHLDVWYKGKNVLFDAGSYRYNAEPALMRYFSGTESHNTIMLADHDQMQKGLRFIWMDWSEALDVSWGEDDAFVKLRAAGKVFRHLGDIVHKREVLISKNKPVLVVNDHVHGNNTLPMRQLWHTCPGEQNVVLEGRTAGGKVLKPHIEQRFYSPTYGVLGESLQHEFSTLERNITTQITLL